MEFTEGCPVDTTRQGTTGGAGDPKRYRTYSGVCNNLGKGRQWEGVFGLPFSRILNPHYDGKK